MKKVRESSQKQEQQPLKCPRCDSLDTKFRYFNNYSRTQARHYCKTCNRQWTVGGNLRNIPFGGKTRNGKQTKVSSAAQQPPPPLQQHQETMSSCYLNNGISLIQPEDINEGDEFDNGSRNKGENIGCETDTISVNVDEWLDLSGYSP